MLMSERVLFLLGKLIPCAYMPLFTGCSEEEDWDPTEMEIGVQWLGIT